MPTASDERVQHYDVIVVGGGQAGLSISWYLKRMGVNHVVLERHRTAHAWRSERWDTFCLVTPNWQCRLPGFDYSGTDPRGFMIREEIVSYLEAYAASFDPPILDGVSVTSLGRGQDGVFQLETSAGSFTARQVVIATGSYHEPIIPRCAERLPVDVLQIHSSNYRNQESMPDGAILVVGTGQSGSQIAEDLHLAGRKVHLCVGEAPRVARFYRGKDIVEWLDMMGYYGMPVDRHPLREGIRDKTNHYVSGRDGGRDIDLRKYALTGMELYGVLRDVHGTMVTLAKNLEKNLDDADAVSESIKQSINAFILKNDIDVPPEEPYKPLWRPLVERSSLDLRDTGISSVIWCIGFRSDYSWVDLPVFTGLGRPHHNRGVSSVSGLYFLGLPWLYTWGSGRFSGVARDAEYIAEQIRVLSGIGSMMARPMTGPKSTPPASLRGEPNNSES